MAVIGNAPFQGLVSGGEILDASIEGVDLSTSAIAARLGYTPVDPGAAVFSGAAIIGVTDNTNAALRITQLGTGNALVVEDSANPDATPFVITAAGDVLAGFSTAPLGGHKAYVSGSAFATSAWRVGDSTDGSTSGYIGNISNSTKSLAIHADPDNLGASSVITVNIDGSEKARLDSTGRFYLGTTTASAAGIKNGWSLDGAITAYGQANINTIQLAVTSNAYSFFTTPSTAASAFTLANLYHYHASQGTIGAGSVVTSQYGYSVSANLIGAASNYGFHSAIPAATGDWNFYASGTANNYFAGNVGIGITTPEYRLDVTATDNVTTTTALSVQNSSRNYGLGIGAYTMTNRNIGGTSTTIDYTFDIGGAAIFKTAATERARIDANGNVGIGIVPTTGQGALQVSYLQTTWARSTTDMPRIQAVAVDYISVPSYSNVAMQYNGSAVTGNLIYCPTVPAANTALFEAINVAAMVFVTNSGAPIVFATTGTERVRIDAAGNVGIGTTSPSTKLHIVTSNADPYNTVQSVLTLQQTGGNQGSGSQIDLKSGGGTNWIRSLVTGANSASGSALVFGTAATASVGVERMRLTSTGILKMSSYTGQTRSDNSIAEWNTSGTTGDNNTLSFDITVPDDSGSGVGHHIEANMTHINWSGYGCILDCWVSTRAANIEEKRDIVNVTSANGGSWTVTKLNTTTLRVTKNAGTYAGGGWYWIKVTTINVA